MILLAYIITMGMNGASVKTNQTKMLDEYCIGVLASEVSPDYEEELLKAQAVMVRTTVYSGISDLNREEITKPDLDSRWYQTLKRIWKETEGQVLLYNNELALVPFHRLSNGQTRNGQEVLGSDRYPYLQSKSCPKDIEAEGQLQVSMIAITGAVVSVLDSAGYVTEVKVGEEVIVGETFRSTQGISSSCFELQEFEGKTRVITRGIGHGLGLSQYTANEMAKEGMSYQEILQYFFEGTEIKEVADILWNEE